MFRRKKLTRSRRTSTGVSEYSSLPSRRIRKERKKVVLQSVLMIIVALVLFLTFIFVIIPGFFNVVTNFLDSSSPFQEVDDIAPQIPIISAPVVATNNAQLTISGYGEPESFVIFILNGAKQDRVQINNEGAFEVSITLVDGENKISAYSTDQVENESSVTREYIVLLDTKPPSIEVTDPKDGSSFETSSNQSIIIKGTVGENEEGTKVFINERTVYPENDGTFSYTYNLKEGENKLEVTAIDKAGNSNKTEVTYSFRL